MQQGDDYDDDYDDDDYYDDEEGGGPSPLVLVVVGVALLMGLGAAGLAGYILVERSKSEPVASTSPEDVSVPDADADLDVENDRSRKSGEEEALADGPDATGGSSGAASRDTSGESWRSESAESWTPSRAAEGGGEEPRRRGQSEAAANTRRGSRSNQNSYEEETTAYRDPPSERRRATVETGRAASTGRGVRSQTERPVASGSGSSDDRNRRQEPASAKRREIVADRGSDEVDWTEDGDEGSDSPGMRPGEIVGGSTSDTAATFRGYEKEQLAALGASAARGGLDRDDVDHLKEVPANHKNFTLAWSTVLKDAETKANFGDHCSAAQRIMSLPQNKYHPEWNLEMAKCHMRNRQWSAAVRSVERTLSDSYGMSAATKSKRVLLAHEILAISKTQGYEKNAKSNAGLSDDNKLRSAIQAWEHYKTFARGIGNTAALQRADKELADLEGKMN